MRLRISAYRGMLFEKPGRLDASQREHLAVVEAILAGDAEAAARAMRDHINIGGQAFADLCLPTTSPELPHVPQAASRR